MSDPQREACLRIIEARPELDGRFRDIRRIGTSGGDGTFSLVVSALDVTTSRRVALKFYRPDKLHETYRWECFGREWRILEQLRGQPDVIGLVAGYSHFDEHMSSTVGVSIPWRFAYFALELADTDIAAVVAGGQWGPEENLTAFSAMCRAVQRIHCRRVAHRDLKPGNFLVMPDGSTKLSDLGTARIIDGSVPGIALAYTAQPGDKRYTAPEIIAGLHDVDPEFAFRADVFSLGAILFELFTGTMLALPLYGHGLANDLAVMSMIRRPDRRQTYDHVADSIADGHPLPNIGDFGTGVPGSIRNRVDTLYKAMCALDYRARLCEFERIFHQINVCFLVLRNEQKYRKWKAQKEQYRQLREEKRKRIQDRVMGQGVAKQ